ncbi:unnamed protein product [Trichobilharzia szidati]|nr:unnamed protein product [Trichobilharzia szidati]
MLKKSISAKPQRCLFSSLENTLCIDSQNDNNKCCQEKLTQICQQSVEDFRQRYNFDLNLMKSVDENNAGIYESDQENQRENNAPTCKCTCHDAHQKLPYKQRWKWEQLDCRKVYIPPFYLNTVYHSDTYLHLQSECANGQSVPPNTPHKSTRMKSRRIYQTNRFDSEVDLSTSEDSLVFSEVDRKVSHVTVPGDCISLPSSPSSSALSLSRLHGARIRNQLDNTSLSSSMQDLSATLVRSQSEGKCVQTNRLQRVVNPRINRFNDSSCDSYTYSNANDKKSMKTVGISLKSSGKWTSCSSVTRISNLKQLKLTDMFPVNKTVKSTTSCNNSLPTSNYVLQSVNRIFCTYERTQESPG